MDQSTHRCTRCDEVKSVTEFGKNSRSPSGLKSWCRPCSNAYERQRKASSVTAREAARVASAKWAQANPEVNRRHSRESYLRNRDAILAKRKSPEARLRHRELERKRRSDAAVRMNAALRAKEWRRDNPDRHRALVRIAQSRRRASQRANQVISFTAKQLSDRMAMFGNKCWMCGGEYQHVDHVKPISRGGADMLANLRPSCAKCNLAKSGQWFGVAGLSAFKH